MHETRLVLVAADVILIEFEAVVAQGVGSLAPGLHDIEIANQDVVRVVVFGPLGEELRHFADLFDAALVFRTRRLSEVDVNRRKEKFEPSRLE